MRIKKLCIGIPNTGTIKTETVYSTIMAMFHTVAKANCGIHLVLPVSCYLTENRETCANEALEVGASHLMFIDSDMQFPENGILTLASRDKYVIGANYNMRTMRGSTVKILGEEGKFISLPGDQIPKEPFKCGAVATGFMLINTLVFQKIPNKFLEYECLPFLSYSLDSFLLKIYFPCMNGYSKFHRLVLVYFYRRAVI